LLGRRQEPQADADAIVVAAVKAGGHDNATAIVIDILEIPTADYSAIVAEMQALPILPPPTVGETVDGFDLTGLIAESPTMRLFAARDDRAWAALKFPQTQTGDDRRRFMREAFLGQRVQNAHLASGLTLADGRQSRLYIAMPLLQGETLEDRLKHGPLSIDEAIAIAGKVGRGLSALHRIGVAHRDIKPHNIMLLDTGEVKIIDLGVARLPQFDDVDEAETPGTIDFMAPELFGHDRGDARSDQFALGVTLYRALTGRYPFGETLPGARPLFGPVPSPSHYRSDVPAWLNAVVMRTIALQPQDRFGDIDELVFELEHGRTRAAPTTRPGPLLARNPVLFWQLVCGLLALFLAMSLLTHGR
jgi:serine/threonine protein kinase